MTNVTKSTPKIRCIQGSKEVGGNLIEVYDEDDSIILDMGTPFWFEKATEEVGPNDVEDLIKKGIITDVPGLYRGSDRRVKAILLSHPHKDHYGNLIYSKPDIPIYLSEDAHGLLNRYWQLVSEPQKVLKTRLKPITLNKNAESEWKVISAGIRAKFVAVDHSAFGAVGILIDFKGFRVAYSGDIRFSGIYADRSRHFVEVCRDFKPHVFVIEGTHIAKPTRDYDGPKTEDNVSEKLSESMKNTRGDVVLFCSSTNIDRIHSFGKCAERAGRNVFMNLSIALLTHHVAQHTDSHSGIVCPGVNGTKIIYRPHELRRAELQEKSDRIGFHAKFRKHESPEPFGVRSPAAFLMGKDMIENAGYFLPNSLVIYSMYAGYLKSDGFNAGFREKVEGLGHRFEIIHTSGHAMRDDIIRAIERVEAASVLPVHTHHFDEFVELGIKLYNPDNFT